MAVGDQSRAPVVAGPVVAHGQAEFIGLPGGLAIESEVSDPPRRAPLQALGHPGVGDHEPAVVENEVTDQAVDEGDDPFPELGRLRLHLGQRLGEAVAHLDLTALEGAHEFDVMVAGDAEGGPGVHHRHRRPEDGRCGRASVNEIPEEDDLPPVGVRESGSDGFVPKTVQQGCKLLVAAVNVADQIEGSVLVPPIRPQTLAFDDNSIDLFLRVEDVDVAEPLPLEVSQ